MEKGIEEWKVVGNSLKTDQHFSREGKHRKNRRDPIIKVLFLKMHVKRRQHPVVAALLAFFDLPLPETFLNLFVFLLGTDNPQFMTILSLEFDCNSWLSLSATSHDLT